MANQQTKRRRKRYDPGSAYAGHVRPTGILGILASPATIKWVFIAMAIALVAGGFAAVFATGVITGTAGEQNPAGFVQPEDEEDGTPAPDSTFEPRVYDAPPPMTIDPARTYVARIETDLGEIEVELLDDQAPAWVNNFVFLARDGFYDGLAFHYANAAFSANAGDPACTADTVDSGACRGRGDPGYTINEQVDGEFDVGTLGMANASQFFITLSDSGDFSGFTPIGRVTSGLEIARQLTRGIEIESVEIVEQ